MNSPKRILPPSYKKRSMMTKKTYTSSLKKTPNITCLHIAKVKLFPRSPIKTRSKTKVRVFNYSEIVALKKISDIISRKCPITLRIIKKPFNLLRNGAIICFERNDLYSYIYSSGDVRDPVTRQLYEDHELSRLSRTCNKRNLNFEYLQKKFQAENTRVSLRDALINELKYVITEFLENDYENENEMLMFYESRTIPVIIQIKDNLLRIAFVSERNTVATEISHLMISSDLAKKYPMIRSVIAATVVCLI